MKLRLSLKGKIALGIVLLYLVVALIVPFIPLRDPMTYKAPATDIFVPSKVDNYSFENKILSAETYGFDLYLITDNYQFLVYDTLHHEMITHFSLPQGSYSSISILRIYPYGIPVFYNESTVYIYNPASEGLVKYPVSGASDLYILNAPFEPYAGFIIHNSTGLYAFQFNPYETNFNKTPIWHINIREKPLGIHYSYRDIFVSTERMLTKVNENGDIVWRINGTFTSNPIFIPTYGSSKVYVAKSDYIMAYSIINSTLLQKIEMPYKITKLNYRGQSLYFYSPTGIIGKVNLLGNGYSWKISNIREYSFNPFIDGIGVMFKDGKIGFVLAADGTIQWATNINASTIFVGETLDVSYLFAILNDGKTVVEYSASGKLITPLPPNNKYLLGTDTAGRDVLSQLLWSLREEIYIALVSGSLVLILGTLWGLVSGYFGGFTDDILLLLSDSFLFIPAIGYAALMIYLFGISQHVEATIGASILALAPLEARAVRNYTKVIKEKPYIESAKIVGANHWRIMFIHILPEVRGISLVYSLSATTMALLLEVGISFLGFGNYTIPTWGWMITNAYFTGTWDKWWLVIPPIFALWLLVYSLYLLSHEMYSTEYIISLEERTITREK